MYSVFPSKSLFFTVAGDADYKPFISSECDIKSLEIKGDEDFLILATDGLWDTINYDEAVTFVYAYLSVNEGTSSYPLILQIYIIYIFI